MKQLRVTLGILAAVVVIAGLYFLRLGRDTKNFRVAVVSIVEIDPIVQLRKGFRDRFEGSQFARDHKVEITEYNAQGDSALINQIADKIAADRPNLVYVLGTPIAQAIQKRAPELLLVQGAVTDPVEAGLAKSWEASGKKYVATSDLPPIEKQVALIAELVPRGRKLGVIFNPGEANSVAVVSRLRKQLATQKPPLSIVERPIAKTGDVAEAVQSLLGNADAIYLPPDNTAHAAIPVIGRFAQENAIPFFATVDSALDEAALATLSLDFEELGKESADLALAVLGGQDPTKMPIKVNDNPRVKISAKAAERMNIDISSFKGKPNVTIIE